MDELITLAIWPVGALLLTLLLTVPVWIRALSSRRWPTTTGRILLSEGAVATGFRNSSILVPDVRYEYTVAGKAYQCRTVRFSYSAYRPIDTVIRYHAGHDVTVY